jgi:sec-independent protein translocase protein TatA
MFGLGHWELLIILVIAMIIFGAGKLPLIGSGLGSAIGNFKKGLSDSDKVESEIHQKI